MFDSLTLHLSCYTHNGDASTQDDDNNASCTFGLWQRCSNVVELHAVVVRYCCYGNVVGVYWHSEEHTASDLG